MKKAKTVFMLLIIAVLLISASGCGAKGSIAGCVYVARDPNTGITRLVLSGRALGSDFEPISGVKVACTGTRSSTLTDERGYFQIDGIKIGIQTLTAVYKSLSDQRTVTVVKDQITPISIGFNGSLPLDPKKWTVLVYMASDNNLHNEGIKDLGEMKAVGSNNDLNVVVQYDGWYDGDSERLYIKPGEALSLEHLGEVDMSKASTLEDFVEWGLTNFPAENTMLVLWNHGGGVWPRSIGDRGLDEASGDGYGYGGGSVVRPSGIAWDDSAGGEYWQWNCLTTDELRIAIENAYRAVPGREIDIINFDACLMQMYEVCLELEGLADYTVGSEEVTPGAGNPYTAILSLLQTNPDITVEGFAKGIVDAFLAYYPLAGNMGFDGLTQSVIKIRGPEWNDFKASMEAFGTALANLSDSEMQAFRDRVAGIYVYQEGIFAGELSITPVLRFDYRENADLGWIVQTILDIDNVAHLPSLQSVAADLRDKLENVAIRNEGATGISIYGPGSYEAAGGMAIMMPRGLDDWKLYKGADQYVMLKIGETTWYDAIRRIMPPVSEGETLTVTVSWENGNLDLYTFEPHGGWYKAKSGIRSSTPNGTFSAGVSSPNAGTTVSETYTLKTTHETGRYVFYVYCSSSNGAPINARIKINDEAELPITLSATGDCYMTHLGTDLFGSK